MDKKYLLAPGPTPIPPEVLLSMAEPIIHHRAPVFSTLFDEVKKGLKYVFQTKNGVLIFASSGTGGMEGAIVNTLSKGDKAIVVRGGKFGERWGQLCQAYGVEPVFIDVEWGRSVNPETIFDILKKDPGIKAVCIQASETSTGVSHDVKRIGEYVKKLDNTITIVDAITALGVYDIKTDEWGLDVVVAGSQKAFMLPPGLAFVSMSEKAWKFAEKSNLPKFYFDFKKEKKNQEKNQTAYTPAVSLIVGLSKVLNSIQKEGIEKVFQRHHKLAEATRTAMKALGLELLAKDFPSDACTAILAPAGIDGQQVVKILREKHGMTIAGGQDHLKGKIFRIAHLGYFDKFDIIIAVAGVEIVLKELGAKIELGKGVRVAEEILGG
ncbi:MAG: class V aminotransferase [Candidatus Schekmanbacteria bacterium GWA2_38_11]|uniref:Class V aminotransferase n=1 Tax=Candidatus Schekmanbacteria bacterium GWA2_38_11 TaxID=1817876 RepID=A0A1F7RMG1_9BACT|nr:MAG: class V aminotransferase [Candidatus Schekmanbacteria bacterium GWA2_38_11]